MMSLANRNICILNLVIGKLYMSLRGIWLKAALTLQVV